MAEAYSFEIKDQAEELYIEQGLTYEQVAKRLNISLNTAKNWGSQYEWAPKRKAHFEERRALKENLRKLRQKMINKASDNLDPSDIYAVVKLERLVKDQMEKDGGGPVEPDIDRPRLFLENIEFIAAVLREVDPEGLKVLSRNFETIVSRFKAHVGAGLNASTQSVGAGLTPSPCKDPGLTPSRQAGLNASTQSVGAGLTPAPCKDPGSTPALQEE